MKRKFIFLAMLLLTLVGGVKWNVLNAQEGVYRIKSNSTGKYMHVFNTNTNQSGSVGGLGAYEYDEENLKQVFRFIPGDNGGYYLQCVENNCYIKCWEWNVDALSSYSTELFGFNFDGESFSISNVNEYKEGNPTLYFKTEYVTNYSRYYIFCDVTEGASNVDTYTLEQISDPAPAAPTNLVVTNVTYNSVSLSWTDENNAPKYRIYKDGVFVGETTEKTYTVTDLEGETTYNFTVKSVSVYTNESEDSNTATATTLVAPKTRTIVFSLDDSYGDGWNGNTMVYTYEDFSETLTHTSGSAKVYEREIPVGSEVTLTYQKGSSYYTYPQENSFIIEYKDGDVIWQKNQGELSTTISHTFTVEGIEPSVEVNHSEIAFGHVRLGNYWSEKNNVTVPVTIEAKNTEITNISIDNDFFKMSSFNIPATNIEFELTCDVANGEAKEYTADLTIEYGENGDKVVIPVTATTYIPVTSDIIELATNVTESAYTNTPDFATLHDDYILPGEATEGSTPDAVYHFTMEEDGVLTVNVTGTNAIAAVYKAEDMEGSGPMANNNYKGIVAGPSEPTTFGPYDFEDGSLDDFELKDIDGDGFNWAISGDVITGFENSKGVESKSYKQNPNQVLYPDNYLITKTAYAITANSQLSYYVNSHSNWPSEYYSVLLIENIEDLSSAVIVHQETLSATTIDDIRTHSLSEYAGKVAHIAIRHHNCSDKWSMVIDNLHLSDGSKSRGLARSTEPQINGVQFPAGEYYLVAAAEDAFTVTIETGSLPAPSEFAYIAPENGAREQNNPILTWEAAQYATEYKVYLGTSDWMTEENLVATVETTSFQTEGLSNNTQYFWKVDAVNETGTQKGTVYSFVTPLDVPQNVTATALNLYPGQATEISWDAVTNASSYNVYNGDNLLATLEPTVTSYELSDLAYNINGHNISITATQEGLGESLKSSVVVIKVAGEFPLVVSVKDSNGNPIEGATVSIDMTNADDQFGQQVNAVNPETTGADGNATFTLPLLYNSTRYIVTAAKAPYEDATNNIYDYNISNNSPYTCYSTLNLPKVYNLAVENGDYVLQEGSELVLTWDVIEGATEYKVYKKENLVETVTTNEFTTTAEYDNVGSKYAVSAVFEGELESDKTYTDYIYVLGNGSFKGYVTDGTSPIKNLTFELSGTNAIGEDVVILTTNAEGYFEGEILEGNDYTLTISHYDYEEVVMSGIEINYSTPFDFGTIVLTAKPSVEDNIDVTATDNGEYASVTWTGSYEKYNVYRRNMSNQQEVELLAEVAASPYTDNEWAELEDGTYQYGVSTFVEEQAQSRGVDFVLEGFESSTLPDGWHSYTTRAGAIASGYIWKTSTTLPGGMTPKDGNYAAVSNNQKNQYSGFWYLVSPLYDLTGIEDPKIIFSYYTPYYEYPDYVSSSYTNKLTVQVSTTTNEGPWTEVWSNQQTPNTSWTDAEAFLTNYKDQKVYIAFCTTANYGQCSAVDNVYFPIATSSAKESQIVWSNEITKQGPATFEGTVSTDWNTAANWSTNEVPAEGADVIINVNAVISSDANVNVKNLNIKSGSLTIEGILAVTGTITNNGNLIINDGAQLFQNNEDINATFNMSIISPDNWESNNKEGWQFISSPFVDATVASFIPSEGEYDLYKYDGTQDYEWINHKGGEIDVPGTDAETEFFFDFEEGTFEGMRSIDADGDDEQWYLTMENGGFVLIAESWVGYELYPDNYIVTSEKYTITESSKLSFSHIQVDAMLCNEHIGVVVSEDGVNYTTIWDYDYNNTMLSDWKEELVELSEYAGKSLHLGIRYYECNGADATGIMVDNIRLSSGSRSQTRGTSSFEKTFTQGVGYLASYEIAATVALNGNLYNKDNFTFKVSHNAEKDLANVHLLGNPFSFNMDWSKITAEGLVDGYAVVNNEGGYDYLTSGTINVGDGFFVKANAEKPSLSYDHSYVAPVLRGSEKANSINVIASGKAGKDNVVVNFAGQSEGFNKLQNFNDAIATVYVTENGKNYGIANVDENTTEVALNFDAKEMGNYTISLDVNGEFETVTLVDRFTGVETNMLLEDEYTFTATSNDNVNRFVIRLANGQEPTANSQFVYQSGEELILSIEGSVQIVDMLGRVVYYNEHANGDNRINVAEFNDAAYVVRVVNEEGVKVQKVVIY
ncbi:MAG: choice-of-anchor J domain-containing protein [Bacteroidales bacterium]|nr:choice-of-anchor J domain-containing protein [Bacteroidales bacterium]